MACGGPPFHDSEYPSDDKIPLSGYDLSQSSLLVPGSHIGADIPLFIDPHYNPRNVDRREARKASKVMSMQKQLTEKNRCIHMLEKKIVKLEKLLANLQSKLDSVCEELTLTSSELSVTKKNLEKVAKEAATTKRKLIKMEKTCEASQNDLIKTELEMERIEEENADIMATLASLQSEVPCNPETKGIKSTLPFKQRVANSILTKSEICTTHYLQTKFLLRK